MHGWEKLLVCSGCHINRMADRTRIGVDNNTVLAIDLLSKSIFDYVTSWKSLPMLDRNQMLPNGPRVLKVLSKSYNRFVPSKLARVLNYFIWILQSNLLSASLLKWGLIVCTVKLKGPKLNLGWVYNETVLNVTFSNTIFVIGFPQAWNWKLCVVIVYPGE